MKVSPSNLVDLQGKIAIITGAARGQGLETARVMLSLGARVVLTDIDAEAGETARQAVGEGAVFLPLEVADPRSWAQCVATVVQTLGHPQILVNNAALYRPQPVTDVSPEDFMRHLAVNLHGPLLGIQTVLPWMIEAGGGTVVNISSVGGIRGYEGTAAYTSAKWGLRGLTRTCANELGRHGIRVNCVIPGLVNTAMATKNSAETNAGYVEKTPLGRIGEPEEIAHITAFLSSSASSFVTGAEIVADGGLTLA